MEKMWELELTSESVAWKRRIRKFTGKIQDPENYSQSPVLCSKMLSI